MASFARLTWQRSLHGVGVWKGCKTSWPAWGLTGHAKSNRWEEEVMVLPFTDSSHLKGMSSLTDRASQRTASEGWACDTGRVSKGAHCIVHQSAPCDPSHAFDCRPSLQTTAWASSHPEIAGLPCGSAQSGDTGRIMYCSWHVHAFVQQRPSLPRSKLPMGLHDPSIGLQSFP